MRDRLQEAIELRSTGHAEEARSILINLVAAYPEDAEINYQVAWVHGMLGREREAVPFYVQAIELGLSGNDLEGALSACSTLPSGLSTETNCWRDLAYTIKTLQYPSFGSIH